MAGHDHHLCEGWCLERECSAVLLLRQAAAGVQLAQNQHPGLGGEAASGRERDDSRPRTTCCTTMFFMERFLRRTTIHA